MEHMNRMRSYRAEASKRTRTPANRMRSITLLTSQRLRQLPFRCERTQAADSVRSCRLQRQHHASSSPRAALRAKSCSPAPRSARDTPAGTVRTQAAARKGTRCTCPRKSWRACSSRLPGTPHGECRARFARPGASTRCEAANSHRHSSRAPGVQYRTPHHAARAARECRLGAYQPCAKT